MKSTTTLTLAVIAALGLAAPAFAQEAAAKVANPDKIRATKSAVERFFEFTARLGCAVGVYNAKKPC